MARHERDTLLTGIGRTAAGVSVLMHLTAEHCSVAGQISTLAALVQPVGLAAGALCLAQFSGDNQWYRGRVEAADTRDPARPQCSVFFVDYGNREQVPGGRVRAIEPQLAAVPPQAVLCTLAYLKVSPSCISPTSLKVRCITGQSIANKGAGLPFQTSRHELHCSDLRALELHSMAASPTSL